MSPCKAGALACALMAAAFLSSCAQKVKADPKAEAPPPAQVEHVTDGTIVKVEHPEQFPIVEAERYDAAPELNVTGTVNVDVARAVPVISLAAGRIIEVDARLGDTVKKDQVLMKVQSADISAAFSDYRQALADEKLARAQLERAKVLYEHGAMAQKDLEVAQGTADKARVMVETTQEHLRVLGADKDHPSAIIEVHAPISGVITDQQVTAAAGTQGLASPNPFTISDLSHVWIVCDVYENDLATVRVGEFAEIRLNAYPDLVLKGRISNIGPVLDPNLRTAKVRLEVANNGTLRLGMFVTATFHGLKTESYAIVPASAILHLHDREWVYAPIGNGQFQRVEVTAGKMLDRNRQEIRSGIRPGGKVVRDALVLQNTSEQ